MTKILKSGLILTGVLSLLVLPVMVSAQVLDMGEGEEGVMVVIENVIDWLFAILIIGAVIVILIAAFTFLTAAGDAEKVGKARNYIVYALVAIVVAFVSKALVGWFQSILT